jgi:endo-1,3(4)-beta-glucanase
LGVSGQDLYFFNNLPIKWVRIVGVVVAVDDYHQRRVYTVDDSSGVCIECMITVPGPPTKDAQAAVAVPKSIAVPAHTGLDVGAIVDVKGSIKSFRGEKQIQVERVKQLHTTEQEVALWERRTKFKEDVLNPAWRLSDMDVQRCRREAEGYKDLIATDRLAKRKKGKREREADIERARAPGDPYRVVRRKSKAPGSARAHCQELNKLPGKYDALGI